jgi:hypothetical protein
LVQLEQGIAQSPVSANAYRIYPDTSDSISSDADLNRIDS